MLNSAPDNDFIAPETTIRTTMNESLDIAEPLMAELPLVLKKVSSILVTQPTPTQKSPYHDLETKYGIKVDFREFTHVEGVEAKEIRRQKVNPGEYSSVILNSKNAVDHFFRCCQEMRIKMSEETKYFCLTETIANYLQKFIVYRKRKVNIGVKSIEDLKPILVKHRDKETFLLPCSNFGAKDITAFLVENNLKYKEVVMYNTVSSDLSDLSDVTYDILVFFAPQAIVSLFENFPDFKQNETRIAAFGNQTAQAVRDQQLVVNIQAPTPQAPSMPTALENYIKLANKSA
jgi:uroporphyrinogen-III synthase